MLSIKIWIMTSLLALSAANPQPDQKGYDKNLTCTTLTITHVKKPWYAWRSLIVSKMKKSIPEYQGIAGLHEKLYAFSADTGYFGGIYQWKNRQDAERWFSPKWFSTTEQKYGQRGVVRYFTIVSSQSSETFPEDSSHFWAVLSQQPHSDKGIKPGNSGLLQVIELKDDQGNTCYLSLWSTQKYARQLEGKFGKNEYFDTPILLQNHKKS